MALLEVARIARAHGLRGEVVVELFTNRTERLVPGSELVVSPSVDAGETTKTQILEVVASRPFQHRYLVSFRGIQSREEAERLHGAVLLAEPLDDPDDLFVHELIGAEVFDQNGKLLGTVTAVEANPASDLLVVDDRHLVPARFITDQRAGRVEVDIPKGLIAP